MKAKNFSLSCYFYVLMCLLFACSQDKKPEKVIVKKSTLSPESPKVVSEIASSDIKESVRRTPALMSKKSKISSPPGIPKRTQDFLKNISNPSESFKINTTNESNFVTKRGTRIKVPKECFVNEKGMYERGVVVLEIKESVNKEDYILNGLPTLSESKMLVSGGVMYMNASAEGKPVSITKGKSIDVKFSVTKVDNEMMLFEGVENSNGQIEWKDARPMVSEKVKKPSVVDKRNFNWTILRPEGKMIRTKGDYCTGIDFTAGFSNKRGTAEDKKEFSDRLKYISAISALSRCFNLRLNAESYLEYYLNAPGSNFNTIDTKLYQYLTENTSSLSLDFSVCVENNYQEDTLFGGLQYIMDQFKIYSLKKNGMPVNLAKLNIDINDKNAKEKLSKEAKLNKEDAKAVLDYYSALKEVEQTRAIAKEKYVKELQKKETIAQLNNSVNYSFTVNKLGWINVDKFYEAPNAIASSINIKLDNMQEVDYSSVGIIFTNLNSYLSLNSDGNGMFSLSSKALPANEPVKIFAVLYRDDKIWYAQKNSNVASKVDEEITLTNVTLEELKAKLGNINL